MRRLRQIISVTYVLALVLFKIDFATIVFWILGAALFSISVFRVANYLYRRILKQGTARLHWNQPAIAVLFPFALCAVLYSEKSADRFADEIAIQAQQMCRQQKKCPASIAGLDCSEKPTCRVDYGRFGTKYPVIYSSNAEQSSFVVEVRHDLDTFYRVSGGVAEEISRYRELDGEKYSE